MSSGHFRDNLKHLLKADLVIGHVSRAADVFITKIKEQDVQSRISEEHILTIPGGKSKQWVFHERVLTKLADEIKGKVHIDVVAPRHQQFS